MPYEISPRPAFPTVKRPLGRPLEPSNGRPPFSAAPAAPGGARPPVHPQTLYRIRPGPRAGCASGSARAFIRTGLHRDVTRLSAGSSLSVTVKVTVNVTVVMVRFRFWAVGSFSGCGRVYQCQGAG